MTYEEAVRYVANDYWVKEGMPDGEEYIDSKQFGRVKLKDSHWYRAEIVVKLILSAQIEPVC